MMSSAEIAAELRAALVVMDEGVAGLTAVRQRLAALIEAVLEVPEPPAPALKPILAGLLDRQGEIDRAVKHGLAGVVITAKWSLLQPMPGILDPGDLILDVHDAKMAGLRVRLRVLGGIYAPDWAKAQFGSFTVTDLDGKSGECWCWWKPGAQEAWRELHRQLAAVFDSDPVIADVDLGGGCGIVAAEPFLRGGKKGPTTLAMVAAGYTQSADQEAVLRSVGCLNEWTVTRGYLAFNPYQSVGVGGEVVLRTDDTVAMIRTLRASWDAQLVLGNDSIRWPLQDTNGYRELYQSLTAAGKPLSFQTANGQKINDPDGTLHWAASVGALSIELERGYPNYPPELLAEVNALCIANGDAV